MKSLFSSTYLSRKPVELAMQNFAKRFRASQSVLDIGCGKKPYARLFHSKYVSVDPLKIVTPDIVAPAWDIPVSDNSFDGVILNQSLEHISDTKGTIAEIKRILKPGGLCIITVPHTMKNHSEPIAIEKTDHVPYVNANEVPYWHEDYYRFTKFGLISLFEKDFKIETIYETSGYAGTIAQLINYFFASFGSVRILFVPIFFTNNLLGWLLDSLFLRLSRTNLPGCKKFYNLIYSTLPLNYVLTLKKH